MSDRDCPIGDCTATVSFDEDVVEMTPRFRLHDLSGVDEFAVCPACEAEIAGFYEEPDGDGGDGDDVELILDIDEDDSDGELVDGGELEFQDDGLEFDDEGFD